ncbi:hypothetical protein S245_003378 [Arachis hypogaea]
MQDGEGRQWWEGTGTAEGQGGGEPVVILNAVAPASCIDRQLGAEKILHKFILRQTKQERLEPKFKAGKAGFIQILKDLRQKIACNPRRGCYRVGAAGSRGRGGPGRIQRRRLRRATDAMSRRRLRREFGEGSSHCSES